MLEDERPDLDEIAREQFEDALVDGDVPFQRGTAQAALEQAVRVAIVAGDGRFERRARTRVALGGQQAAAVGREFGSPLAAMRDYLQLMTAPTMTPPAAAPYARIIAANGPKMIALAAELADGVLPAGGRPAARGDTRGSMTSRPARTAVPTTAASASSSGLSESSEPPPAGSAAV